MAKFYWTHKKGGRSQPDGAVQTARSVIADYINRNLHKTAEQLKVDLDIMGNVQFGKWRTDGRQPFILAEKAPPNPEYPRYYYDEPIRLNNGEDVLISNQWGATGHSEERWNRFKAKMAEYGYTILVESEVPPPIGNGNVVLPKTLKEVTLLRQFKQIILYGPPGTGKTYRAKTAILPQLLGVDKDELADEQGERWDIVQFHPSYNYEDFVRGVKVGTDNGVDYKTVDRVFGSICVRAERDPNNSYVLIIDEINRANVSAVLGELIYALEPEYRGEPIETPYDVDGGDSALIVPENLYIIGTMNTADRTIGQIDYAVRRRFAFVHCPPNEKKVYQGAIGVFSEVQNIFNEHISHDYDADDVRIGHSYFRAEGSELARKILYQVVPILREYVKDGVLLKSAEKAISKIEESVARDAAMDSDSDGGSNKRFTKETRSVDLFYYSEEEGVFVDGINADKENDSTLRRCRAVSIEDIPERCNWDSCAELGFVLMSGVSNLEEVAKAKERIHRIRLGDIVVAMLLRDSQGLGGVIGWGEITGRGEPISKFKVNGIPILDCPLKEGQTYREKYPMAAADADDEKKCDWMFPVKWRDVLQRKDAEYPSHKPRIVFRLSPRKLQIVNAKFGRRK